MSGAQELSKLHLLIQQVIYVLKTSQESILWTLTRKPSVSATSVLNTSLLPQYKPQGGIYTPKSVKKSPLPQNRFMSADYILYYKPNIKIAVIEAKDNNHSVGSGMQQALNYAEILDIVMGNPEGEIKPCFKAFLETA